LFQRFTLQKRREPYILVRYANILKVTPPPKKPYRGRFHFLKPDFRAGRLCDNRLYFFQLALLDGGADMQNIPASLGGAVFGRFAVSGKFDKIRKITSEKNLTSVSFYKELLFDWFT